MKTLEPVIAVSDLNDNLIVLGMKSGNVLIYNLDLDEKNSKKPFIIPSTNVKIRKFFRINSGNYFISILKNQKL